MDRGQAQSRARKTFKPAVLDRADLVDPIPSLFLEKRLRARPNKLDQLPDQSSGVGNCINTLSLARVCAFPLLMIVTMRGEWGEANPWQVPMGQIAADTLRLAGAIVYEVTEPEAAAPAVEAAARIAFNGNLTAAVLLSQRMLGAKLFKD